VKRLIIKNTIDPKLYEKQYSQVSRGSTLWEELIVPGGKLYEWEPTSTYIREPPFFMDFQVVPPEKGNISGARVLAYLGNSITTDHISPAGWIFERLSCRPVFDLKGSITGKIQFIWIKKRESWSHDAGDIC
jgi:aconitase A